MKNSKNQFILNRNSKGNYRVDLAPWPLFVRPKEGELFSSWLYRLAARHLLSPMQFINIAFRRNTNWGRDIDRWIPDNILETIAERCTVNYKLAEKTTIRDYLKLSEKNNPTNCFWIIPQSEFHGYAKRHSLQFCPRCLNSNGYFKKEWRLSINVCCSQCRIHLHDACPNCQYPIHLSGKKESKEIIPLTHCQRCKQLLTTGQIKTANDRLLFYQDYYLSLAKNHDLTLKDFKVFQRLKKVIQLILQKSNAARKLQEDLTHQLGIDPESLQHYTGSQNKFNYKRQDTRSSIFFIAGYLLEDWPNQFQEAVEKYNLKKVY